MIRLLALLAFAACAPACAPVPPPAIGPQPVAAEACDDGGSGGVLIDGICL